MTKITVAARAPYSVGDVVDVLGPYLAFTGGKRGVDGWTGKRMTVLQVNGLDLELARPGHDSEVWLHAGRCEPVFVSSEQFDDASPRRYTVRQFDPSNGCVDTFGEFNELGRAAAVTLAKLCASGEGA